MKFVDIREVQKIITNPEIQKVLSNASAKSPLGAIVTESEFEAFLNSDKFGTAVSVTFGAMIKLALSKLHNPTPGSVAGEIGTNRIDSNLKDSEVASRLGLYLDTYEKLQKDENGNSYYDPAYFTGESEEFSFTVYPCIIDGVKYYLLHNGGHRLFLWCQLLAGVTFPKVRRDGQHDKYIYLYNKHFAGKNYKDDAVMRETVNKMLSYLPVRIKLEREDFDMPIRNECKPYKNNESLHKSWASSKLYKFFFNLHKKYNAALKFVANSRQGAFKFCNDLALVISQYFGYYLSDTKTATKCFYYDTNHFANDNQYSRVCKVVEDYLALYSNPDVYPFLRAFDKYRIGNRAPRYDKYKNGTTMGNSYVSVQMVLDAVFGDSTFQYRFSDEYATWKKEQKANQRALKKANPRKATPILDLSFRNFFETTYLNVFDMTDAYRSPESIFEARLILAEQTIAFFKNNEAYCKECGIEICDEIARANISDGVGKPSKYKDIIAITKKYFGRRMQKFYSNVSTAHTAPKMPTKANTNKQKGVINP